MASNIQPPLNTENGAASSTSIGKNEGRALLDLLRARDKKIATISRPSNFDKDDMITAENDQDEIQELEQELIQRLSTLNYSVRRRGLFNNDLSRAKSFYFHAVERGGGTKSPVDGLAASGGGRGEGKKRKRNKGSGGGSSGAGGGSGLAAASFGIFLESHHNANNNTGDNSVMTSSGEKKLSEGLFVTVICRILGVTIGRRRGKKKEKSEDEGGQGPVGSGSKQHYLAESCRQKQREPSLPLICIALNILSSLCDHAKDGVSATIFGDSSCASVEAEMMASIGVNILDALSDNMFEYFHALMNEKDPKLRRNSTNGLFGSLKACSSVVSLLETRLSRAEKTIKNLKEVVWIIVNNSNHLNQLSIESKGIQKAATSLLAILPLTGNSENTPPNKLWTQSIRDGLILMEWAIHDFFPMPRADGSSKKDEDTRVKGEAKSHPDLWNLHQKWVSIAKEATSADDDELDLGNDPTDDHRSRSLLSRIQSLCSYLHCLLVMEGYPIHRHSVFANSAVIQQIPLDMLLNTSEQLLSFPLAAEAKYRATKSRLRSSPVHGGLISPHAAMTISASMRMSGHTLFDVSVESCKGGSGILGRAHRVVGMSVANLASSCSLGVLSVVDGKLMRGVGGNYAVRMGWLRGSIPLRIQSILSFQAVVLSLGSGVMSSNGTVKSISRALVLLGGCLLEQVLGEDAEKDGLSLVSGGLDEEWGTLGDRAELVETASTALAACIAAFGGLIPNDIRATIDSIAHSCLSSLYVHGDSSIFAYSNTKKSILQLGMNCVCVPWGDGGRSTIGGIMRSVCTMLRNDPDVSVATVALSTLCAFDALVTPRAPPILIPVRDTMADYSAPINRGLSASEMMRGINDAKKISNLEDSNEKQNKASDAKKSKKKKRKASPAEEVSHETKPQSTAEIPETMESKPDTTTDNHSTSNSKTPDGIETLDQNVYNDSAVKSTVNEVTKNEEAESSAALKVSQTTNNDHVANEREENDIMVLAETESPPGAKPGKSAEDVTSNTFNEASTRENTNHNSESAMGVFDRKNDSDQDDEGSDFDFPEIIDGDPDEEDRI